jgi:hypothetical protein
MSAVGSATNVREIGAPMSDDNKWVGDSELGERFPAWTRGNAADVFPDPFSPLGKSLVLQMSMSPGLRDAYIEIGALNYDELENPDAPDLFKMFGGYVYNPLTLTRVFGYRMPGATPEMIDKAFFDDNDEIPPYEHQDWHDSPDNDARLGEMMGWAMSTTELPMLDADRDMARAQRANRPDLAGLTDYVATGYLASGYPAPGYPSVLGVSSSGSAFGSFGSMPSK